MAEAHEIVVDPFLLCLPDPCSSSEQLEQFISSLLDWRGMLRSGGAYVLISDSVQSALSQDGEYPHRYRLSHLLKQYNCEIADEQTISQLTRGILERTPSFDDYFGIDCVLIDEISTIIEPTLILSRLKEHCRSAFIETLVTISIVRKIKQLEPYDSLLIASTIGFQDIVHYFDEISLEAEVHEISFLKKGNSFPDDLPFKAVDKIPVLFKHDELLSRLGLWALWNNALNEESVLSAIDFREKKLIDSGVNSVFKVNFVLGLHFLDSVQKWGCGSRSDYAMVIIESCARIVLGIPKNEIKEFREKSDKSAKQRIREDGALAYRTHLTKKGVGLRLMFWKLSDGSIEFANIGGKDQLEIL
jgi:hypothetical protein